ncbi:MAG: magnesium/cobalt transporter CorA [Cryomorphaceae bacterium]
MKMQNVSTQMIQYTDTEVTVQPLALGLEDFIHRKPEHVTWVNFCGFPDVAEWDSWKNALSLNAHMMADSLDPKQRPLMEEYDEALFLSVKSIVKRKGSRVKLEHISFILTQDFVLTVQERVEDRFEGVKARIAEGRGIVRKRPVDYLVYRLLEAVVQPYGEALTFMEDHLDDLERDIVERPNQAVMESALNLKRDLTILRHALVPMKEVLGGVETSRFIQQPHLPYFRDVRDQIMQLYDRMESIRSMLDSMESLYLSSVGQRTNEVMRVLTVFSAVFLPITFVAGVYGMNFQNMPETQNPHGYFIVLCVMASMVAGMLYYMKRKGWL